jgi:tRNA(fMet)-specific endonuclease VapC
LLDTTFLIDSDRSGSVLDATIDDEDDVAVAAITIAELRVGVLLSTGKSRRTRQAFLDEVLVTMPILNYDLDVAEAHAELLAEVRRQGSPRGAHDLVIAATARATRRVVTTADLTAFDQLSGVEVRFHR